MRNVTSNTSKSPTGLRLGLYYHTHLLHIIINHWGNSKGGVDYLCSKNKLLFNRKKTNTLISLRKATWDHGTLRWLRSLSMWLYRRPSTSPCMIQVSFQRLFTCCEKVWEVFSLMSIICDESTPVNLNCTVYYSPLFSHLGIELPAELKSDRTSLWYTNKTISTTLNVLSSYIYVT